MRLASETIGKLRDVVAALNIFAGSVQVFFALLSLLGAIFHLSVMGVLNAGYVVFFAGLVLAFEFRTPVIEAFLRLYFGFLFSIRGLALYLLFLGLMSLGLAGFFGFLAGWAACLSAMLVLALGIFYPEETSESAGFFTNHLPDYGTNDMIKSISTKATTFYHQTVARLTTKGETTGGTKDIENPKKESKETQ